MKGKVMTEQMAILQAISWAKTILLLPQIVLVVIQPLRVEG